MGHTLSVMGDDPLSKWSADDFDTDKEKVFLGAYSRQDLEAMFDKYLFPPLAALFPRKGFVLDVDVSDPFVHQVSVSHELLKDKPADAQVRLCHDCCGGLCRSPPVARSKEQKPLLFVSHSLCSVPFEALCAATGL